MNSTAALKSDKYLVNEFLSQLSFDQKVDLLDYHDFKNIIRSNRRLSEKQIHAITKLALERRGFDWAKTILYYEKQKGVIGRKIKDEKLKQTNNHVLWRNYTNEYIENLETEMSSLHERFKKKYNFLNAEYEKRFPSRNGNRYNTNYDKQTSDILFRN